MNVKNETANLRATYILAVIATIVLGLTSRKYGHLLPPFIAQHAGDLLWAMMVYFGFRFLLVRKSLFTAFLLSFLFSFGIEFSQLYQADWINQIRSTFFGALILGRGFIIVDLIRYAGGILVATVIDKVIIYLRGYWDFRRRTTHAD